MLQDSDSDVFGTIAEYMERYSREYEGGAGVELVYRIDRTQQGDPRIEYMFHSARVDITTVNPRSDWPAVKLCGYVLRGLQVDHALALQLLRLNLSQLHGAFALDGDAGAQRRLVFIDTLVATELTYAVFARHLYYVQNQANHWDNEIKPLAGGTDSFEDLMAGFQGNP